MFDWSENEDVLGIVLWTIVITIILLSLGLSVGFNLKECPKSAVKEAKKMSNEQSITWQCKNCRQKMVTFTTSEKLDRHLKKVDCLCSDCFALKQLEEEEKLVNQRESLRRSMNSNTWRDVT